MSFNFLKKLFSWGTIKFISFPAKSGVVIINAEIYKPGKMDDCFGFYFLRWPECLECYDVVFADPELIKWLKSKIGKVIQVKVSLLGGQVVHVIPTCFEQRARCKCGRFVKPGSKCSKCYKRKKRRIKRWKN